MSDTRSIRLPIQISHDPVIDKEIADDHVCTHGDEPLALLWINLLRMTFVAGNADGDSATFLCEPYLFDAIPEDDQLIGFQFVLALETFEQCRFRRSFDI